MFSLRKRAIANKIKNNPLYRFQSLTEIEIAAKLGVKIDVNQASVDDWLRLPGISIHQAKILVSLVKRGVHLVCIEDVAATLNISVARLLPLEPILYFAYYDRMSSLSPQKINLNQACLAELQSIPLWDDPIARLIIQEREERGQYHNFAEVQSRLNLSNDLISQLIYYVEL